MTLHTKQGVWVVPPLRRGLDSRQYTALGGHVGAGFDAKLSTSAEALSSVSREMSRHECIVAPKGADSACVQVQEVEQQNCGGETHCGNHCRSIKVR